jgi:hypothetical protein
MLTKFIRRVQTEGVLLAYVTGNPTEDTAAKVTKLSPCTLSAIAGKAIVCPDGVGVRVWVRVLVRVLVLEGVAVLVRVLEGVAVSVAVRVGVAVRVSVRVLVGVAVGPPITMTLVTGGAAM